jgi:hypothetical protein
VPFVTFSVEKSGREQCLEFSVKKKKKK